MRTHLRIARPVSDLERSVMLYRRGLGLDELGRFHDHAGFDGVILGAPGMDYHLEFTFCRAHPLRPTATLDDLLVFYVSERADWAAVCARMLDAGFDEVAPFNPYWQVRGRTFRDHDSYNVVLEQSDWMKDREHRTVAESSGDAPAGGIER
jgi:catechol 2,3-dioxygenase-like lactoylglutathione lyase family enzyme